MTGEAFVLAVSVFFLSYFVAVNGGYLAIHLVSLLALRRDRLDRSVGEVYHPFSSPFLPGIAIVVPAYNEQASIVPSVRSLLNLKYPNREIVVVNDGSRDATVERLLGAFDFEAIDAPPAIDLPCEPVDGVYTARGGSLVLIDKANGGKADALNAGVFYTDRPLFCAIDADSLIERGALFAAIQPFLADPERTIATGGAVRVANGCSIRRGRVERVSLSAQPLAALQSVEYLRAFLAGRVGLSKLRSLLIISGAFGVFRTDVVREVGGYSTGTITEDMELVVRLHRHCIEAGREYRMVFLPEPVVWTEVPTTRGVLSRQRRRWYRGLLETLWLHRDMIGNPRYGAVGLIAMPFFLFIEALGPLIEGLGYVIVPVAFLFGLLNVPFFLLFLGVALALGTLLSWLGVASEVASFRRYSDPHDVAKLLGYGLVEHVLYRQWKAFVAWRGLWEYLRGETAWGEMVRVGFEG